MKRIENSTVLTVVMLVTMLPAAGNAAGLTLVEDGKALVPIVVFEGAPPRTRGVANELAGYIEKIGGARPDVLHGRPDPLPERALWVGYQPALDALFPDLDFDFRHPEEILIAANGRHLVIAGRDVWDPDTLGVDASSAFRHGTGTLNGFQSEYGTANAVYTFLMDYLGVRWLWPGEDGEDVPEMETIAFELFELRYHPQIRDRDTIFWFFAIRRGGGRAGWEWARFNRLQLDSLYTAQASTVFRDWFERFHEKHPEYFALQPDGTRSGFPGGHAAKLCVSNPAVWQQWLRDVEAILERHPFRTTFSAVQSPPALQGHCICENCRAWDHPDAELVRLSWQGIHQEYFALSDRYVTFANRLAELLEERFPGKNYKVGISAEGPMHTPPVEAVAGEGVIVGLHHSFFQRHRRPDGTLTDAQRELYTRWTEMSNHYVWCTGGGSTRWIQGGPVDLTRAMDTLRFVGESGAIGMEVDIVKTYWSTQGPLYYLMAQLAWDPSQDGREVMADYYQRGFGPAAAKIAAYWSLLETTRRKIDVDDAEWGEAFTPEVFERGYALLHEAAAKVEGERGVFARRVAYVRSGLDFLRLTTENLALDVNNDEEFARMKANWVEIECISREYPLSLNANHVGGGPRRYLRDLFPQRD